MNYKMAKYDILYIGELPPPYGGVSVKNQIIYQELSNNHRVYMIDMVICKRQPWRIPEIIVKIMDHMRTCRTIVYGLGTNRRLKIMLAVQRIICGLSNAVIFIMGGEFHTAIINDYFFQTLLKETNSIWVESNAMVKSLNGTGILNAYFFPNCRADKNARAPIDCRGNDKIKLVFFSRICEEKGVKKIFEAYNKLREMNVNVSLDFYGDIAAGFQSDFQRCLDCNPGVNYHGTFDAAHDDVYGELNQYDAMVLLSSWHGEGIPGALVESKMSGITAIVNDWNFISEVVLDGKEGIVLPEASANALVEAIQFLAIDKNKLQSLKEGAYASRKRYRIETYQKKLEDKI